MALIGPEMAGGGWAGRDPERYSRCLNHSLGWVRLRTVGAGNQLDPRTARCPRWPRDQQCTNISPDRKSVVSGKSVTVRVDIGGRRTRKKNKTYERNKTENK